MIGYGERSLLATCAKENGGIAVPDMMSSVNCSALGVDIHIAAQCVLWRRSDPACCCRRPFGGMVVAVAIVADRLILLAWSVLIPSWVIETSMSLYRGNVATASLRNSWWNDSLHGDTLVKLSFRLQYSYFVSSLFLWPPHFVSTQHIQKLRRKLVPGTGHCDTFNLLNVQWVYHTVLT